MFSFTNNNICFIRKSDFIVFEKNIFFRFDYINPELYKKIFNSICFSYIFVYIFLFTSDVGFFIIYFFILFFNVFVFLFLNQLA